MIMAIQQYYRDDLVLLTNTPAQAKSLLHSLEQMTRGISFYQNKKEKKQWSYVLDLKEPSPL